MTTRMTAAPFDAIADTYDESFSDSSVGRAQRRMVWLETDRTFRAGQRILEINCGTGIDALHLANRGIAVLACDASPRMIEIARARLARSSVHAPVDFRCVPTERIASVESEVRYDGVFSNFAGLNCLLDLRRTACDLARFVKPGGKAIFCVFGPLCLWETIFYLAGGNFKKAFRRFSRIGVVAALSDDSSILVHYPTIRQLQDMFSSYFHLESWKGIGVAVPPSYLEHLAVRFPRSFEFVARIDPWLGRCRGFRALADHVVLTFERRKGDS
jgi:ubiquinone/menaquinone biosynthesis C-methylase UbiE